MKKIRGTTIPASVLALHLANPTRFSVRSVLSPWHLEIQVFIRFHSESVA